MEIFKGLQIRWEKWKSEAGEREMRCEEMKRYFPAVVKSPTLYKVLSPENRTFVDEWAEKIRNLGGFNALTYEEFEAFCEAFHKRQDDYVREQMLKIPKHGCGDKDGALLRSNIAFEARASTPFLSLVFYRIWLTEWRAAKGLPPNPTVK